MKHEDHELLMATEGLESVDAAKPGGGSSAKPRMVTAETYSGGLCL